MNTNITTEPFPGFPTDLQAQIMALLSIADGELGLKRKFLRTVLCMYRN